MNPIETFTFANGVIAEIHQDQDCERPYSDDDMVRIVVLHRSYIDPSKGSCGRTPEEIKQWTKDNAREWFVVNLFMYDHSGTAYRVGETNPFGDPWDSGQVGIIALKKSEWGKGKGEKNAKRFKYAQGVAEEYTSWANGNCYGYIIKNEDGDELDSCWGFIGMEYIQEEVTQHVGPDHAKAEGERLAKEADEQATIDAAKLEAERPDLYA